MGAKLANTGSKGGPEVNAEPNVIPFVDVMLVLLIIFMVAAPIATVDVKVDLPASKVIPSKRPGKPTYVSVQDVTGGMRVFVGNDQVELAEIGPKTVDEVRKNNRKFTSMTEIIDERIYIRAQRETQYRNVVFVMNRLQDSGFYKIALVAEDRRR